MPHWARCVLQDPFPGDVPEISTAEGYQSSHPREARYLMFVVAACTHAPNTDMKHLSLTHTHTHTHTVGEFKQSPSATVARVQHRFVLQGSDSTALTAHVAQHSKHTHRKDRTQTDYTLEHPHLVPLPEYISLTATLLSLSLPLPLSPLPNSPAHTISSFRSKTHRFPTLPRCSKRTHPHTHTHTLAR